MDTREDVELDDTILDDEPACEFHHAKSGTICTVDVTHVNRHCKGDALLCECATEVTRSRILALRYKCSGCGGNVEDCWKLNPA